MTCKELQARCFAAKENATDSLTALAERTKTYDGTGSLSNTVLLRFVKNRYKKLFVTYDLDAENAVAKTLKSLGLEKKKHFLAVGTNAAGKRSVEGLLPENIVNSVYGENAALVQAATHGNKDEQKSAKNNLKKLLLAKFKEEAKPGNEYFGGFYPLIKAINKALC